MKGQISDEQFWNENPKAHIYYRGKRAITRYGKSTINRWIKHNDNSWTNNHCNTIN